MVNGEEDKVLHTSAKSQFGTAVKSGVSTASGQMAPSTGGRADGIT